MSADQKHKLVVDFSVLPERPKLDVVQRFVQKGLGIAPSDLRSIQLHNIRHCVLIEMADPAAAIKIADDYHLKYAFKNNPTIKIPVYIDDNTVDVRVHDLPLDLPNAKIIDAMREYGEVLTIRDEVWKNFFAGVPNGVRVVKMKLSKPVPSFITVCELSSLATYTGQTATCRRCGENRHVDSPEVAEKDESSPKAVAAAVDEVDKLFLAAMEKFDEDDQLEEVKPALEQQVNGIESEVVNEMFLAAMEKVDQDETANGSDEQQQQDAVADNKITIVISRW
ncbi:conserved hypothetical protein [Culex quinquefasciatus]|uniref:Uncharacterized protein n=1 Tax=Culex quinquefasciatus TaxID=7176 RepID=B0X2S4_CULQU|nr:conserved hypothetical protein [Culex quinquefasciatus]|eukprot:XP_001863946.1 conserved hypothetical protein [Culex quinquefasciatus]